MATEARPQAPDTASSSPDVTLEELQLAARNHSMPLEALQYPITPIGLHYLLTHFDIPLVDPTTWRLAIGGRVRDPLSLTLDNIKERPAVTRAVTLECAGNGRARLSPRPLSQPWLFEAVGTAEWTGTALRPLLEAAGPLDDAVEVVLPGSIAASRAASSSSTSGACPWPRHCARRSSLPMPSTDRCCPHSTATPSDSSFPDGMA